MMGAIISSGSMAGAFLNYPSPTAAAIRPYQASYGAVGLARASEVSGNSTYVDAVWHYLNWYAAHMDSNGYGHDWDLTNGVWTQGGYDSTDAYAGMFLVAIRAAYEAQPDSTKLSSLHTAISMAVSAIHSTQQSDGLTWAIPGPTYQVKLLEDNVEVFDGLNAAVKLANALGDTALANAAQSYVNPMPTGLEHLWNSSAGWYYWALHQDGALQSTNWSNLSPDTMEQAWAVAFNVSTGSRDTLLTNEISAYQSNWDQPSLNGGYYEEVIGWAFYNAGNVTRAQQAATNIRNTVLADNRAWPFTPADCGELIILETNGEAIALT